MANYSDGIVTTLLNNQNGTFTANTIGVGSGAGSGPQALAIDGAGASLLLAVANYKDNTVSVMQSQGNGNFGTQTIIPVGMGPDDVNFADFNGDGLPDLVVSNYISGSVNLILEKVAGGYSVLGPFKVGNNPYSAAVGDLDLDGTPDIVVSNYSATIRECCSAEPRFPCRIPDSPSPLDTCSIPPIYRTAPAFTDRVHPLTSLLHNRKRKRRFHRNHDRQQRSEARWKQECSTTVFPRDCKFARVTESSGTDRTLR